MESLQTELMSIGRFARLTGLTGKALRHYDEVGLLRPAEVDAETGYRSYGAEQVRRRGGPPGGGGAPGFRAYGAEQVRRAETIRRPRRLELPLDDVATLLATDDPEL